MIKSACLVLLLAALLIGCSDTRVPVGAPHSFGSAMLVKGSASFHGALTADCSSCHDKAIFCGYCHFGPSGSREPSGSAWTHGLPGHSVGALVTTGPVCVACHEIKKTLSGAPANSSCVGCHEGAFAPHALPYGDNHRPAALADLKGCQTCHGAGGTSFTGGVAATGCATCHDDAGAHPTDWQGTGAFSHREAGNIYNACVLCHDVQSGRVAPLPAAPSCFSASFTNGNGQNRGCHSGGWKPHDAFINPALHGPAAKADLGFCQNCHGTTGTTGFGGGPTGVACDGCHIAARAHPTDWQGSGVYSHRTSGKIATACANCHDYTSGRTPPLAGSPSCFAANFTNADGQASVCHPFGPTGHPRGQAWLDKKSATFHGNASIACDDCHTLATYCSPCHFGPTGSKKPIGSSWTHGRPNHDNYGAYISVCNTCHTLNRSYGNGPGACHDCHD